MREIKKKYSTKLLKKMSIKYISISKFKTWYLWQWSNYELKTSVTMYQQLKDITRIYILFCKFKTLICRPIRKLWLHYTFYFWVNDKVSVLTWTFSICLSVYLIGVCFLITFECIIKLGMHVSFISSHLNTNLSPHLLQNC